MWVQRAIVMILGPNSRPHHLILASATKLLRCFNKYAAFKSQKSSNLITSYAGSKKLISLPLHCTSCTPNYVWVVLRQQNLQIFAVTTSSQNHSIEMASAKILW